MDRRTFLAGAVAVLGAPLAADAQQVGKVPRIGVLVSHSPEGSYMYALRDGLRELGYVEGQNIAIEWRFAHEKTERLPGLAADLVRLGVEVIVVNSNPVIQAAQKATRTIPIVMVISADPVRTGFIASLARPGGNITGLSLGGLELVGKRLQVLKEAVPNLSQVAILWNPALPIYAHMVTEAERTARELGVQHRLLEARTPNEIDRAFATMTREGTDAALVVGNVLFYAHRARMAEQAAKLRLPMICPAADYVAAGCLMSFGPSFGAQARRAAYFVDRILKGAKPGDLPVEQPTRFELVINRASRES